MVGAFRCWVGRGRVRVVSACVSASEDRSRSCVVITCGLISRISMGMARGMPTAIPKARVIAGQVQGARCMCGPGCPAIACLCASERRTARAEGVSRSRVLRAVCSCVAVEGEVLIAAYVTSSIVSITGAVSRAPPHDPRDDHAAPRPRSRCGPRSGRSGGRCFHTPLAVCVQHGNNWNCGSV